MDIKDKALNEIDCPFCKTKMLGIETHLDKYNRYKYVVCCDWCDWYCPVEFTLDRHEAFELFKDWLIKYLDELGVEDTNG